ncbi:hypothetical protein F5B17DRAFT_44245 [Nemania serpens]|nr:hypothetical protein F5B17DRAFT_44245 [Nemania serpens]
MPTIGVLLASIGFPVFDPTEARSGSSFGYLQLFTTPNQDHLLSKMASAVVYHYRDFSIGFHPTDFPSRNFLCVTIVILLRPQGSLASWEKKAFPAPFFLSQLFPFFEIPQEQRRKRKRDVDEAAQFYCAFSIIDLTITTHRAAQAQQDTNENTSGSINERRAHSGLMEDKS